LAVTEEINPQRIAPDLQALVAKYGGYDLISRRAWEKWDRESEEYQQAIRRDLPWPPGDRDRDLQIIYPAGDW
jgi:hypothetical protein